MERKEFLSSSEETKALAEKKRAKEIGEEFARRREERRRIESGWLLNMNFFNGNQYCDVSPFGGVVDEDKQFYWQARRVFNRIAPTVEARIAKLEKARPLLSVRACSDEDGDLKAAKLACGVLGYVTDRIGFLQAQRKANVWAEVCGSVFYKVSWDENGGRQIAENEQGEPVYEGEVRVDVVPPFEIFPDTLTAEGFDEVKSVIHARVVCVDEIYEKFGVEVQGEEIAQASLGGYSEPSAGKLPLQTLGLSTPAPVQDAVILIERYQKPCAEFPDGRLEIVAGERLLYSGALPFCNGERGARAFPFVKQDCLHLPAAFFGGSIVDRLVPVQRAYNAVRNRKHEFLNRISMGVLTVEDGSVDTDELTEEGLLPGKVLVYRQGGEPPKMLDCGSVPAQFAEEEKWLEREFELISGVSDLSESSTPTGVTSATGLQLLLAQDESRLAPTLYAIEQATKEVGEQILALYKQFAGEARLMNLTGENKKTQAYYFNAAELSGDIRVEADNSITPEEKRTVLFKLYEAGLLTDDDGRISQENKARILEAFGFGGFENARDISALHIAKAGEENVALMKAQVDVDEFDEHDLHITEHTRFLLSAEFRTRKNAQELKARWIEHIREHKQKKQEV